MVDEVEPLAVSVMVIQTVLVAVVQMVVVVVGSAALGYSWGSRVLTSSGSALYQSGGLPLVKGVGSARRAERADEGMAVWRTESTERRTMLDGITASRLWTWATWPFFAAPLSSEARATAAWPMTDKRVMGFMVTTVECLRREWVSGRAREINRHRGPSRLFQMNVYGAREREFGSESDARVESEGGVEEARRAAPVAILTFCLPWHSAQDWALALCTFCLLLVVPHIRAALAASLSHA